MYSSFFARAVSSNYAVKAVSLFHPPTHFPKDLFSDVLEGRRSHEREKRRRKKFTKAAQNMGKQQRGGKELRGRSEEGEGCNIFHTRKHTHTWMGAEESGIPVRYP